MEVETKKRKIINQFIKNHIVEKIDHGKNSHRERPSKEVETYLHSWYLAERPDFAVRGMSSAQCQKLKNINL